MRVYKVARAFFSAGSFIVIGCKSTEKPAETTTSAMTGGTNGSVATMPAMTPTTTAATLPTTVVVTVPNAVAPVVITPETVPAVAVPAVAVPVVAAPATAPAIIATHVVTKDQPYFSAVPASPTAAPDGTFKSGTKVLVFSFSGAYAKVTAEDGTTAYTATEGIDPITAKK